MMLAEAAAILPVERLLESAVTAYRTSKFGEAELQCKEILKQKPDHIAALQLLAAVAGQSGAPRRGIELIQKVIALQPTRADAHVQLAKLLRQDHQIDEAIAALKTAIEAEPANPSAHNDLGLIYLAEGKLAEAAQRFSFATDLSPGLKIAHFNKGLAFERQGLWQQAIAAFRAAVKIAPDFAEAHAKLGNLLFTYGDENEALDCLRCAAAAKPGSAIAALCEARLMMEQGKAAGAEEKLRLAIQLDPQNSDAHSLLATALMELGRFEDAGVAADLSVALNRWQIGAYHLLVHAKKLSEADRPLIDQIEWMLKEYALANEARAHLHLTLGKAYDDLGEYDVAMRHFDQGNSLKERKQAPYSAAADAETVDRIIERFGADFFTRNAGVGSAWDVPIVIVGMPRSGTTLVEQILSSHPNVAAGGELSFWGDRAALFAMDNSGRIHPGWARETAEECRKLLSGISSAALRVTDKRPQNFNVIALIHAVFPCARIIHCRRHPVDTCLSIYFQNFAQKMEFSYNLGDLAARYHQYRRLMAHWRNVLPAKVFIEVQYEELVANPEPVTRRMIEFVGLEWDDACLHHERNKRAVRTASVWQARQPVYRSSVARWKNYRPWLGPLELLLTEEERAA